MYKMMGCIIVYICIFPGEYIAKHGFLLSCNQISLSHSRLIYKSSLHNARVLFKNITWGYIHCVILLSHKISHPQDLRTFNKFSIYKWYKKAQGDFWENKNHQQRCLLCCTNISKKNYGLHDQIYKHSNGRWIFFKNSRKKLQSSNF